MALNGIGRRLQSAWFGGRRKRQGSTENFYAPVLPGRGTGAILQALFNDYFFETPVGTTGQIKFYNGSAFVAKPVKVWTGAAWVVKPLKVYNGSTWIVTSY